MNHQVILADDSLTIQKVIKITLANQPYSIFEADNEEELINKVEEIRPALVLLDFNLSENHSGYDLTSQIKKISPETQVLLLLGTFDTVDESLMEECGAAAKIVKPFDSNKFITICRELVDSVQVQKDEAPVTAVVDSEPLEEDQWTMSNSNLQNTDLTFVEEEPEAQPEMENPLLKEISDWGISVPGIINKGEGEISKVGVPPVIGPNSNIKSLDEHKTQKNVENKNEVKFPDSEDLDYPTIEELAQTSSSQPQESESSQVLTLDPLNMNEQKLEIEGSYVEPESNVKLIEDQIKDEVHENLWQVDEFEDLKEEVSSKIEEVKSNFLPSKEAFDESLFRPIDDSESISWNDAISDEPVKEKKTTVFDKEFDQNQMRIEMEEMVKKYVKEYMDQLFQSNAEKVAWEVIPDLAENLIRQELSKISNKVLND